MKSSAKFMRISLFFHCNNNNFKIEGCEVVCLNTRLKCSKFSSVKFSQVNETAQNRDFENLGNHLILAVNNVGLFHC